MSRIEEILDELERRVISRLDELPKQSELPIKALLKTDEILIAFYGEFGNIDIIKPTKNHNKTNKNLVWLIMDWKIQTLHTQHYELIKFEPFE
jgi:hypothetical protein